MGRKNSLDRPYSIIASFQNLGERILFSFSGLYADRNGATASEQGILLSLRNILSFMGQGFFGRASDRYGRAIILSFGFLLSAISTYAMLSVKEPVLIIITFAFYSLGFSAIQPAWSALIGDTYEENDRAKMLGHIGAVASIIGGVFYLSAGFLSGLYENDHEILFAVATISFIFAFIMVILLSFKQKFPEKEEVINKDISIFEPFSNKNFRNFVLFDASFAFAMSTTWPLFPKVTNELMNTQQVAFMWFLSFLGFSVTAKYMKQIKNYIGSYNRSLFLSRAFLWIVPFSFAFATSWIHLVFARIIAGISFGFYTILQKDYVLETVAVLNRPEDRGWFLGSHGLMFGVFTFVGSLLSGFFIDYIIKATNEKIYYDELFLGTAVFRFIMSFGYLLIAYPAFNASIHSVSE
ncbi:MAG: MFS transporter [Candidatus Kariarchaeaceae archaeon]